MATRTLIRSYRDALNLDLDMGKQANIEALRDQFKHDTSPVRAKKWCYSLPKRESMVFYVLQLLKIGFVKKATQPQWILHHILFFSVLLQCIALQLTIVRLTTRPLRHVVLLQTSKPSSRAPMRSQVLILQRLLSISNVPRKSSTVRF